MLFKLLAAVTFTVAIGTISDARTTSSKKELYEEIHRPVCDPDKVDEIYKTLHLDAEVFSVALRSGCEEAVESRILWGNWARHDSKGDGLKVISNFMKFYRLKYEMIKKRLNRSQPLPDADAATYRMLVNGVALSDFIKDTECLNEKLRALCKDVPDTRQALRDLEALIKDLPQPLID